jgi:hypothetical protein
MAAVPTDRELRRRARGLANVFKWPIWLAQLAGVVVATPVAITILLLTMQLPAPARFVLGLVTFVAVGTVTYLIAFQPRTRQALEVFVWLGEREIDQFSRETDSRFPGTTRGAGRWLERHPEVAADLQQRVDVLLMAGEFDQAAEAARRLPATTAWERFTRELQIDHVERVLGSGDERPEVRVAAAALETPEELREADALLAWSDANRRALAGGDWREPLVAARRRLGANADGTLRRARLLRGYATALAVVGALLAFLHL